MAARNKTLNKTKAENGDSLKDDKEPEGDGSSSLTRMLGVLDLFTVDDPLWSTPDILDAIEATRSTGYRYIKALTSAGLLSAVGNGYYLLGPRIIELDLQIRKTDPLLQASEGILEQLATATGHSALLCMLFQNSVICVKEHRAELSPTMLISRGQRRPLFKGAMSKIILAHLSIHQLRNIFSRRQADIGSANLGNTWDEFRGTLAKLRSDGYARSAGEFTPGVVGVSAPVFNAEEDVIGSVGVAWGLDQLSDADVERTVISVKRAGREISRRMLSTETGPVLGPRAVG